MIAQTIQLALAPVFVLVAMGSIMNTLSQRLGRVVDRSRQLQEMHSLTSDAEHDVVVREMRLVDQRIAIIGRAILSLVVSGLTIGLVVAILFLEEIFEVDLQLLAAFAFLFSITLLMWALLLFLQETRVATETLRVPEALLEKERVL